MRLIDTIWIHCAATPNGSARYNISNIDEWHGEKGFIRRWWARKKFNPRLKYIGYHHVINPDGTIDTGRHISEVGAHTYGHNKASIGVCLMGFDKFTQGQWAALREIVEFYLDTDPGIAIRGHQEASLKECPGFDVQAWLAGAMEPLTGHICESRP